jgi:pimeloyl-ACP methyl ester carboxylesterase
VFTIIPISLLTIGAVGSRINMYGETEISVSHFQVMSEYDGINLELNYLIPPEQSEIGVIVAHGFASDRWGVHNLALSIAKLGAHVVAMDYRGHGISGGILSNDLDIRKQQAADDMLAAWKFLHERGCENIFIIGHSMGGFCATRFSMTYPDLINGSVVIGATMPYIGEDLNETHPKNTLFIMGNKEELFTPEELVSTLKATTGNISAELGVTYGSFQNYTARKAEIIGDEKNPITHAAEQTHPLIFEASVNWINTICDELGIDTKFDQNYSDSLIPWMNRIQIFNIFIYIGIFFMIIPISLLFPFFFKLKKLPPQKSIKQQFESIQKKLWGEILSLILFQSIFLLLGIYIVNNVQISWISMSSSSSFFGALLFMGVTTWILLVIFKIMKRNGFLIKKEFSSDSDDKLLSWKNISIDIFAGLIISLIIPISFQLFFYNIDIPNVLGGFPSKLDTLKNWFIFSVLIGAMILPGELILNKVQKMVMIISEKYHLIKFLFIIVIGKILSILMLYLAMDFMGIRFLTMLFTIVFIIFVYIGQIIGVILYHYNESSIPPIFITSILTAWIIISLLPST